MYRSPHDPERMIIAPIRRLDGDDATMDHDALAVEEPLEIWLGDAPLAVIMRTPGHDDELAAGFLHGEGLLRGHDDIAALHLWRDAAGNLAENRVTVELRAGVPGATAKPAQRRFYAGSSCGLCGKTSIDAVLALAPALEQRVAPDPDVLYALPERLRAVQSVFDATGGLHGAGLFDLRGNLETAREDVGRHNGVDKLIGHALLDDNLPLGRSILLVSGRVSFEIVQKALLARIPVIAAVSAPTSLAVQVAARANIVLAGFLRDQKVNLYT
ncbi:MAG: formate dehydrogenase accessory sulfurtransferase FdhD [Chloroflexota bacterium]